MHWHRLSLLRQWGCSGPATKSLPHLCDTTDRLTIMLFCDIYDIDIGATLNLLQCLHVSCFIDLIDYVPEIGYGSIIDFHSVSRPGTAVRAHVSAGAVDNEECSSFDQGARRNMAENNLARMPLPLRINQFSFQYLYFVTIWFTIDKCPAATSYSPTKTPLESNGALLVMWQ